MKYATRTAAELSPLATLIARDGIVATPQVYGAGNLAAINAAIDEPLRTRQNQSRSYVMPDEMVRLGVFHRLMNHRMRDLMASIMPDPVLLHFHIYEIAAEQTVSHIFADRPGGWHRDGAPYFPGDPTHVSVFVYLKDVFEEDGPFELVKQSPENELRPDSLAVSMTGIAGTTFAWHRSHYHRAAPNRGPRRRRLMKASIQRNAFPSKLIKRPHFEALRAAIPPGDPFLDTLLGRFEGQTAPQCLPGRPLPARAVSGLHPIGLSAEDRRQLLEGGGKEAQTKPSADYE